MLHTADQSEHHVNMEQRRTSNASDTATPQDGGRPVLSTQESIEFIPTRGSKVTPPKPAANPLQFIKVGPCDLYKTAQEQIKKVEEVKKIKAEVRDDAEDWQSNLDNWKCGRRKRQEHIIERVVEVKKLELEEHDRNRRRSKTFNEMMEDRNTRGRKTSLMVYKDDEANDLSDLGIGTSSGDDNQSLSDRDERPNMTDNEFDTTPSELKEEYTSYDLAIQTYVNFAEKARNNVNESIDHVEKKTPPQLPFKPRRESAPKIEEKIAFLDGSRRSSTELSSGEKVKLVKVDVLKRRELFERGDHEDSKSTSKVPSPNVKVSGSIKDRLSSLEQQKPCEKINAKEDIIRKRLSNGDMSPPQSVKERLSSLQKQASVEQKQVYKVDNEVSIKERVDNLDASVNKLTPDFENKFAGSERSSSPEDEIYATKRTQFHRSLDSLDRDEDLVNGGFDRVQSLEDIDLLGSRHYPPSASSTEMLVFSSQSGDTDREDSGIHTADVSSSVSQADEDADLDVEVVNHRRQLSEQSEQLSPLPPIQEIDAVVSSRGDDKSQSDDEPVVEAVIAQRCSENMMLATRESAASPPDTPTSVELVNVEVETETKAAPVENIVEEMDGGGRSPAEVVETEILPLTLDGDVELLSGDIEFPLGPATSAEPPKEKPPPPPTDLSDEETTPTKTTPPTALKRGDSTKRIKKEIRRKRSDFLGIEGNADDSYLEPVLSIAPDMTAFLLEEQRQQKQLYRQSICSESDSNPGESRDSGVELDMRARTDDHQPLLDLSAQHSRQESEIYGNGSSVTSEEDEIAKKEREIIEMLEKEEQWRYANNANEVDLGEKLAEKLRQLEQEKLQLEWERREEERRRIADENARREDSLRLRAKEQELREQEATYDGEASHISKSTYIGDGNNAGEVIRSERERLIAEQEELVSQRENLILRETQQLREQQLLEQQLREQQIREQQLREQQHMRDQQSLRNQQAMSMQDVSCNGGNYRYEELPPAVPPAPLNYHLSMPELAESTNQMSRTHRAPPPIPPAKPMRSQDQRDRSIINSRVPSADYIQQDPRHNPREEVTPIRSQNNTSQIARDQDGVQLRRPNNEMRQPLKPDVRHSTGSQMSRQTLQALSAAPRSRIVSTDNWIQAKRKPDTASSCNYQHWLIQEAEHRRITEMNQRQRDKPLPDAIINTLTQRVQNRAAQSSPQRRQNSSPARNSAPILKNGPIIKNSPPMNNAPIMVNTVVVNNNGPPMNKSPTRQAPTAQAMTNGSMMNHRASNSPNVNNSPMKNGPKMSHGPMNGQPMNGQLMNGQQMNGQLMNGQQMNGQPINVQPVNGQPMNSQPLANGHVMNGQLSVQLSVQPSSSLQESQEKMLSVSGKKKCSHCSDELGRGAAMIIESLRLFYHIECFQCCVCHVQLGDGLMGTDVRVRNNKLHCHNCYSSDDGVKFSCV